MNKPDSEIKKQEEEKEEKRLEERERKIDEQLEQSFPASDPPSYSQPGNDSVENDESES